MRILIVEDTDELRQELVNFFTSRLITIDSASDGEEGLFLASEYNIDLAIIDLGLPKLDGISLIKKIRAKGKSFPIIILTARDRWQEKVEGLEAGADDYMTKPFHMEELAARVNALIRRTGGWAQSELKIGEIILNTLTHEVQVGDRLVNLTTFEYKILEYLMTYPNQVISKNRLIEALYSQEHERDSNVIEVFMRRLRQKLDPQDILKPIETLRGRGYKFIAQRK
ncbi:MAG: response regulator transcription factor [Gammaproteobacteria bacterium]|nr:response regulator transcription factor [Gammaproteobacteria bacterium]